MFGESFEIELLYKHKEQLTKDYKLVHSLGF